MTSSIQYKKLKPSLRILKLQKNLIKYVSNIIDHANEDNSDFDPNIHLEDDLIGLIKYEIKEYRDADKMVEGNE